MAATNKAAFLDGKGKTLRIVITDYPEPSVDEIIIRNHAIAINPVDWKIQDSGYFVRKWPIVLGADVAGVVVEVGSNVTAFRTGDRVLHHSDLLAKQENSYGAFQLYTRAATCFVAKLPAEIAYSSGCVLPVALNTAGAALYVPEAEGGFALPMPSVNSRAASDKTIVVWGASSSVGTAVVQLAVASGARVIATASKHNHSLVRSLGASAVFDYRSPSIVEDIVAEVNTHGRFAGIFDAVSLPDSFENDKHILEALGAGNLATTLSPPSPEELPKHVKTKHVWALADTNSCLWRDFVTQALINKTLRPLPEPLIVGKGLESIQIGLKTSKQGVSARKVVVELV